MQDLRTILSVKRAAFEINHQNNILMVGSCFTEHIGQRLKTRKFKVLTNPFGIVYNPHSIVKCFERALDKQFFKLEELIENQGLWHSWEHHGQFSGVNQFEVVKNINQRLADFAAFLEKTDRIILTLGTSDVFKWKTTGMII